MSFPDIVWQSAFDNVCGSLAVDASNILSQGPPPKRRKTQLACNFCRVRKTKCDGGRPVCYACKKRGSMEDCLYEEGSLKTRKHIQALESRLEQLEKGHDPRHTRLDDGSEHRSTTHSAPSQSTLGMDSPVQIESPDALATVSTCVHHNLLYGASSTIAFVEHVLLTTGETDKLDGASNASEDDVRPVMRTSGQPGPQTGHPANLELLPIRRTSDKYLQSFWDVVHPVFPILHRPTFARFYGLLWEPTSLTKAEKAVDDPVMLAIVNLVLAIGCRFTECVDLGSRALQADQLYQRARGLVPIDSLDVASLPTVQLLLLTAVHLQSTMYSSRCWNIVGLAIRVAQSLGLHLDRKSATRNQLKREMGRRIWYTCVTLDRLMSTTFGRPAMLSHTSLVPLPLMVDDEHLVEDGEGTQPAASPCRMGLFVYTVQLLDILNEVVHCFYAEASHTPDVTISDHQDGSMPDLHEMLRLNSKLDKFLETLPSNLSLQTVSKNSDAPSSCALLQARILYCRFLYTRLLLLRPVILFLARSASGAKSDPIMPDQNSLGGEIAGRMCQVCLDTAHELISVLHQEMGTVYRCSAWWTVYFTFGAATVVLASLLSLPQEDTTASVDNSLSLAMEIFKHYTPEVRSSAQAIRVIETLRDRLSRVRNTGTSTPCGGSRHTEGPSERVSQESEALFGFNVGNAGGYVIPDPLSEHWFSHQAMNFNFEEFLRTEANF